MDFMLGTLALFGGYLFAAPLGWYAAEAATEKRGDRKRSSFIAAGCAAVSGSLFVVFFLFFLGILGNSGVLTG